MSERPGLQLTDLFIGIAGMIGAGKSTLAAALGQTLNLPVYYEPVGDNAYLADFYRDTKRYSFATQIYLLNRRFAQHQEIIWRGGGGTGGWCCVRVRSVRRRMRRRFRTRGGIGISTRTICG